MTINRLQGKVIRNKAEVIVLFKVDGKWFPSTGRNRELFETYMHTGDEYYLEELENEMEGLNG